MDNNSQQLSTLLVNYMKSKNKNYILLALLAFFFLQSQAVSAAEYIYISDNLRVGIRTEPVSGIPPISVVFTGMRLKVEERTDGYIKVTTDKGVTGWIKDIYATKEAPATIQLNHLRLKHEKLKKEHIKDLQTFSQLEKANRALNEKIDELKSEKREWQNDRVNLMASQQQESYWYWLVGIIALFLGSFIAGALWYRTRAMKRLGGLRV